MNITKKQLSILRHAIGRDDNGYLKSPHGEYRNHYVAARDDADCLSLVAAGLMVVRLSGILNNDDALFCCTESGKEKAREGVKVHRITRSQARYRRWLMVADTFGGMKFGEWLKFKS